MRRAVLLLVCGLAVAGLAVTRADIDRMLAERATGNLRPLPFGGAPARRGHGPAGPGPACVDSVIRDDFSCNDDTASGCTQNGPDIAAAPSGAFVISWYEFRDGDADAWFQRFDAGGNAVGQNERLNTDITLGWQGDPASAMAANGGFMFSWEDRRDIGNSDVFCQRFDPAGVRQGDNFRISDSAAAGDQDISAVRFAPDGTALVAWDDRRNGLTGDIFAQFLNPDGSPRDTNFRVNDDAIGQANQYEPEVGCDSLGRFVVVWMDGRGLNAYDWNIFGQRFNLNGSRIGANIQVTTNDSIQWAPHVGAGPGGGFVVSWDDKRRGQADVYAQLYNASGQPVGANFRVSDDAGTADQYGSDAAMNRYGEFLVVWADKRDGDEDIYGQRYLPDGSPAGSNFKVSDAGSGNQGAPSVAPMPDGGYRVAWADSRAGNLDIYARRLNRDGSVAGQSIRVNTDYGSALQRVSSIGMERQGRSYVAWEDERNGPTDAYGCLLDEAGRPVGSNRRLNDDPPAGPGQYYCAVGAGDGRFVVAWTDARAGLDIYGQFLDGAGQPVGPNFRANSDTGGAYQWYPYCAMDSLNRAVVVWMDTRGGPFQYYGRLYDAAGNPAGPEFAVQDSTAHGYYGSAAMNRAGRFVVAWMDYRDGDESNVYCQVFRPDGSRVGSNFRVNTDPGRNYQGYPACAIDGSGRSAVAWEDTRNGNYDVYVQWFDSTGTPLGDNERLNDGATAADCYSPTCAFAPDGRLAVMFNDERETPGNPQIFCQRFRADRTRDGLNRKVNNPNLFPHNHHWTVGQSIAASLDRLAFAWTENRRHLGWDIFAKLTDWNLVGIEEPRGRPAGGRRQRVPTVVRRGSRVRVRGAAGPALRLFDACGRLARTWPAVRPEVEADLAGLGGGAYFLVDDSGALLGRIAVD